MIEDAAQGVNATYKDAALGAIGDLGVYSFHENKNFICGEGGALVMKDAQFSERAEMIREKGTNRSEFFRGQVDKYTWVDLGSSFMPSDILAAFLYAQLEHMDTITAKRRTIFERYYEALQPLAESGSLTLPTIPKGCQTNYHMFQVLTEDANTRSELIEHLRQERIQAIFHYVPLHTSPVGRRMGYRPGMLPVTEDVSERLLRLPFYHAMTEDDIVRVANAIRSFYGGRRTSRVVPRAV